MLLTRLSKPNPYGGYALALDFDNPEYWNSGVRYNPLSTFPGHSFFRSGEQGAVDSDGSVDYFAADTPAINGNGYHAYGALTNLEIQSQTFGSRTLTSLTVTANTTAAPDGTTTADTLVAGITGATAASVLVAFTAAVHTTSVFLHKTAGTASYAYIRSNGPAAAVSITVDKATGTITGNGLAAPTASYAIDCGAYWRIVMVYTAVAGSQDIFYGPANASNTRNATNGETVVMWQAQTLVGDFPDGGPLIATAGTTASIGESAHFLNSAPTDEASLFFCPAIKRDTSASDRYLVDFSNGTNNERIAIYRTGANYRCIVTDGGVAQLDVTIAAPADGVEGCPVLLRSGGNWRFGKVVSGVLTWAAAASAGGFPTLSIVNIGSSRSSTLQLGGEVKGVFVKPMAATTDADVLAAVAEAA